MTQDERWIAKYNGVSDFMEINHRNPFRHRIEEHEVIGEQWLRCLYFFTLTHLYINLCGIRKKSFDFMA